MDFRDKKIIVMGLGLLGRGVGVVKYLTAKGARVMVTDLKSEKEIKPSVDEIKKFLKNKKGIYPVKFILGKHRLEDFRDIDMVFKAAGVPLDSPYIAEAKRHSIPVVMDDSIFAREAPCEIIGITGTRGKTTTSALIHELARATGKKVYLAGNIRGTATLPLLGEAKKDDLAVLELSSWQLQGWRDEKISPHIAVMTNIFKDHMNYYKNNIEKYIYDKAAIFENQTKSDYLVLNQDCPYCQKFGMTAKSKIIWFRADDVAKSWHLKILGKHNLENIAAATAVGKLLGLSMAQIKKVVENFSGIEGRLEFIKEINGIRYYNDTTATMPDATIAALKALNTRNLILIAGGADKNLNFKNLVPAIKKYTKAVVLLNGTATPKLNYELGVMNYELPITIVDSMREAVKVARKFATRGDAVLLSPAAASFGMFKNEFDRGDQFFKEVRKIK